ncbi:ANTAR domain-containing protein [Streptomyces sp. ODS28]|uniref:ANTAR domain-containing response regulator n=1 Tax=Streptomyces sp. ODS28 TaxID=3136688 RepID=UPI0031EFCA73
MSREQRLADVFVELADSLVDDFDVVEYLHRLAERCVELLQVGAAGLVLTDAQGELHTAAASEESPTLLGLLDLQQESGPCRECCRTAAPVPPENLAEVAGRWPEFAAAGQAAGYASSYTVPLRLREDVIGALHLLSAVPVNERERDDAGIAQALADAATVGIVQQRTRRQRELLAEQLQTALDSRVVVEQAKGVLAERRGISVDESFAILRRYARSQRLRLSDVARRVVERRPLEGLDGAPERPSRTT